LQAEINRKTVRVRCLWIPSISILFTISNTLNHLDPPMKLQMKLLMDLDGGLSAHNFENAAP